MQNFNLKEGSIVDGGDRERIGRSTHDRSPQQKGKMVEYKQIILMMVLYQNKISFPHWQFVVQEQVCGGKVKRNSSFDHHHDLGIAQQVKFPTVNTNLTNHSNN
jgi:hypothetical protein